MRTVTSHRLGTATFLAGLFVALLGSACQPGDPPAGSPPAGTGTLPGTDTGQGGCSSAQVLAIFTASCGSCHGATSPTDGLDLVSANLGVRLANKASVGCTGKVIVDPGNAASSYLLDKLQGDATCGVQMPKGKPALDATSINCVADWIDGLSPGTTGSGGDDPPPSGGGNPPGGGW